MRKFRWGSTASATAVGSRCRDHPPAATMTRSNVQLAEPETTRTPCASSCNASTGVEVQNLCAVALGRRDGREHRPVGPQEARARIEHGRVVVAHAVLRVPGAQRRGVQHGVRRTRLPDVAQDRLDVAAAVADRQAAALGEDLLPRVGLQLPPQTGGSSREGARGRAAPGTSCGTGGCRRRRRCGRGRGSAPRIRRRRIGQVRGLPQRHAADAAQADDGELVRRSC